MSAGGFLDRWSRRKREAQPEEPVDPVAPAAAPAPAPATPAAEDDATDTPLPDLPPLDSLTADTSLTPFLQKGVPEALKNAALRRMWLLDPAIRDHVDFAVDYAWDWNVPGGVPGHGGAIARDSVERFLDGLKAPAERQAARDEAAPPEPEPEAADPAPPPPTAPATPEAQPAVAAEPEALRPPVRRHGGAIPS